MVNCGRPVCRDVDLDEVRDDRPWGRNNPRWQLYAYGPSTVFRDGGARMYNGRLGGRRPVGRPTWTPLPTAGARESGPRPVEYHRTRLRAAGTRRIIEATVARDERGMRVLSWREAR
jgi:hypothetical protein